MSNLEDLTVAYAKMAKEKSKLIQEVEDNKNWLKHMCDDWGLDYDNHTAIMRLAIGQKMFNLDSKERL